MLTGWSNSHDPLNSSVRVKIWSTVPWHGRKPHFSFLIQGSTIIEAFSTTPWSKHSQGCDACYVIPLWLEQTLWTPFWEPPPRSATPQASSQTSIQHWRGLSATTAHGGNSRVCWGPKQKVPGGPSDQCSSPLCYKFVVINLSNGPEER